MKPGVECCSCALPVLRELPPNQAAAGLRIRLLPGRRRLRSFPLNSSENMTVSNLGLKLQNRLLNRQSLAVLDSDGESASGSPAVRLLDNLLFTCCQALSVRGILF